MQDKDLLDKIKSERDAIFSLAAKSLKEFVKSGYDFKMSEKGKSYLKSRIVALHSVEEFLNDRAVVDEKGSVPIAVLYNNYKQWCIENALDADNKSEFKESVLSFKPSIGYKKVGPKNKRAWGFKGIRLKTSEDFDVLDNSSEVD